MKVTHDRITVFNSLVKGGKSKVEVGRYGERYKSKFMVSPIV
ncbi:MAG: hypothetical protein WKG06_28130 [Segetibacter sp.]